MIKRAASDTLEGMEEGERKSDRPEGIINSISSRQNRANVDHVRDAHLKNLRENTHVLVFDGAKNIKIKPNESVLNVKGYIMDVLGEQ